MYKLEAIAQEVSTLLADAYAKHIKRELPEVERQTLRSLVQEAVQGEATSSSFASVSATTACARCATWPSLCSTSRTA